MSNTNVCGNPGRVVSDELIHSTISELEWGGDTQSHNADQLRALLGGPQVETTDLFSLYLVTQWLKQTYVQRSDQRQQEMGLSYMETETHALASAIFRNFVAPLQARIAVLERGSQHE